MLLVLLHFGNCSSHRCTYVCSLVRIENDVIGEKKVASDALGLEGFQPS